MEAPAEHKQDDKKISVSISYNGVIKMLTVEPESSVEALLNRAIKEFGTHQLVLYWPDGREVDLRISIQTAGIANGTSLLLRPHVVRGGM